MNQAANPPMKRRRPVMFHHIPPEAQEARLTQLAEIRIQRELGPAELAEREDLERKQYFRTMNRDRAYGARRAIMERAR